MLKKDAANRSAFDVDKKKPYAGAACRRPHVAGRLCGPCL